MRKASVLMALLAGIFAATSLTPRPAADGANLGGMLLKGAAIGYVVKQSAGGLNKFINTVTFNKHIPTKLATKVVPVLSVGEKAYVGGAQVTGPSTAVKSVKAVWQYEDNFSDNRFRLKVLVPSNSLNPIKISRVSKVGVSALIDVGLAGGWQYETVGKKIGAGDVLLAAGVAVAVKNFGPQLNKGINTISFNKGLATRVVPMASFGEKAYIGGGQVSGSSSVINKVNAVFQYEDFFSSGKFRVKIMVPTTSSNPLKFKRVEGAGVTAVIDMSLARQRDMWDRDRDRNLYTRYDSRSEEDENFRQRHDNGLHKGWYKGKHKGWYKNGKAGDDDRREIKPVSARMSDWLKKDKKSDKDDDKDKRNRRGRGRWRD